MVSFGGIIRNGGLVLKSAVDETNAVFFEMTGSASNLYTGSTTLRTGVSLQLNKTGGAIAIPGDLYIDDDAVAVVVLNEQIHNDADVTINGIGRLQLGTNVDVLETIGGLYGDGEVALSQNGNGSQIQIKSGDFSGTITGGGSTNLSVIKYGSEMLTLSGDNTYLGITTVAEGELRLNGSLGLGILVVSSTGKLSGTGSVLGQTVVFGDGILSPGESPGKMNFESLILLSDSITLFELGNPLGTPGIDNDLVVVNDILSNDGTILNIVNLGEMDTGEYILFEYGSYMEWNPFKIGSAPAGFNYEVDTDANDGTAISLNVNFHNLQFWDGANDSAPTIPGGVGGSANWNTTTTNWTNEDGEVNNAWADLIAVFGGTAGTVTLEEDVTISGMHFLTDGYVIESVAGETLTPSGEINILMDEDVTAEISSQLTGTGGINKGGDGTLILTGENDYTGGTSVSAGVLRIGEGGTNGSIVGDVVNQATLIFDRSDDIEFGGQFSGGGDIYQNGGGKLTFSGDSSAFIGTTYVDAGVLEVASLLGGDVEVASMATLEGNGRIYGEVAIADGGEINPVGVLRVGGLSLSDTTVLNFQLGAPGAAGNSRIDVDGMLFLNGLLNIVDTGGFNFGTYTLMNYGGVLDDAWLTIQNLPPGVNPGNLFINTDVWGEVQLIHHLAGSSQYWDGSNGMADGKIHGGSGIWNTTGTNWTNQDGTINAPWIGEHAVFGGQAGDVYVGGYMTLKSLVVQTSGYRFFSDHFMLLTKCDAILDIQQGTTTMDVPLWVGENLIKKGTGLLNLRGYTVAMQTLINQGSLAVNHILNSPQVHVNGQGTLQGNGTITGNVFNSGRVAPGNSIGRLTIQGNYTQSSAGRLEIEVQGVNHHDTLHVSGRAHLDGTLEVRGKASNFEYGDQIAFLRAGTITGKFDEIEMPASNRLRGRFLNYGNVGVLLVAPTSYTLVAETVNQMRVAKALDSWIGMEAGDIGDVTLALDLLREEQYGQAFDAIAPGFYESALSIGLELSQSQGQVLNQQLNARRLRHRHQPVGVAEVQDFKSVKNPVREIEESPDTRWMFWGQGSGIFSEGGMSLSPGEDFESGNALLGADYRLNEKFTVGLFANYGEGWGDYDASAQIDIDRFNMGGYFTYDAGGLYVSGAVGGGRVEYDIKRPVQWATLDRTARSHPEGNEFFGMLGSGYDVRRGNWTFGPQVSLQYSRISLDGFDESGADSLNLRVDEAIGESLRSLIGGRLAYTAHVNSRVVLIPEVRAFWQHEYIEGEDLQARLNNGQEPGFSYMQDVQDRDALFLGAGVTGVFGKEGRFNSSLYYNSTVGRNEGAIHTLTLTAGWEF